ncbi:MAG TPA: hypothetical protein VIE43_20085 [Thermoanaerobaculia bacterium]|jgi:hypothetical protein|nr:hypothetical protein [Thermoanaerobaculia bacterium]
MMLKVRQFAASVAYRNPTGQMEEEEFPVNAPTYSTASDMAFTYVLQVLKLKDFELRIVGA